MAKELARITGYTLFHNHLTRDLVGQIYPDNLAEKYELVDTLRLNIFDFLARHNTNTIFTYVYDGPDDDRFVEDVKQQIEQNDGRVWFVELRPSDNVLLSRVNSESRREYQKLTDRDVLKVNLQNKPYGSVPHESIFRIDNSKIQPEATAQMIADRLSL